MLNILNSRTHFFLLIFTKFINILQLKWLLGLQLLIIAVEPLQGAMIKFRDCSFWEWMEDGGTKGERTQNDDMLPVRTSQQRHGGEASTVTKGQRSHQTLAADRHQCLVDTELLEGISTLFLTWKYSSLTSNCWMKTFVFTRTSWMFDC